MKVYIVEVKDYGDNGWSIEAVFDSREKAERYIKDNPLRDFYYEIEEFEVRS